MGNFMRKNKEPNLRKSSFLNWKKSTSSTSNSPNNSGESFIVDSPSSSSKIPKASPVQETTTLQHHVLEPPEFEEEDRKVVLKTWVILERHIAEIGMNAYSQLFKRDPQIVLHFPFLKRISKDEYENFLVLKNHAIRVMGIINILVQQLNYPPEKCDPELIQTLQDLGQKHFSYGASRSNIELLGKLFMESFMLPFNEYPDYSEIRRAWSSFFDFIIFWIKDGFQYVHNKGIEDGAF